ncbi:hypothetical protein TrispH2_011160 [Trichoplax sp. H2]|uniref:Death domain-containing protein n=1 Tax=Trichoplax adhaerens TaxID=10228 RepID=B3S614_TRIAD|nr:predicted protein [Trichoplax adhaerens]EDV22013.1 predicted protein [Trichoplax adhaerens]RDD36908.1 hypothetical protein TrispH2_011160 [Trichoplax sp. H2]|eukprot:XP_002115650.1 predicted protein [Trichoplax adhaerens]
MGLNDKNRAVLTKYRDRIMKEINVRTILPDLIGIITYDESDKLYLIQQDKSLNLQFIRILENRSDENWLEFCYLLQRSEATAIQELGKLMEKESFSGKASKSSLSDPNPAGGGIVSLYPDDKTNMRHLELLIIGSSKGKHSGDEVDAPLNPNQMAPDQLFQPQVLMIVSSIGTDWAKFALALDMAIDTDVIAKDHSSEFDRAFAVIKQFSQRHPTKFTASAVAPVLLAIGRKDIVEKLQYTHT